MSLYVHEFLSKFDKIQLGNQSAKLSRTLFIRQIEINVTYENLTSVNSLCYYHQGSRHKYFLTHSNNFYLFLASFEIEIKFWNS